MASNKDSGLKPRQAETRDKKPKKDIVVRFELDSIFDHFHESLNYIRNYLQTTDYSTDSHQSIDCKYIWRSQIVFLESILDFYLHELSKYAIIEMFKEEWKRSDKYYNFQVPLFEFESCLHNTESTDWLLSHVNKRFSSEVYLSFDKMKDQINLIGLDFNKILTKTFSNFDTGKQIIKNIFKRRNQIVHQFDREHSTARQLDITKEDVENCIMNIEKLVIGIHNAAKEKEA